MPIAKIQLQILDFVEEQNRLVYAREIIKHLGIHSSYVYTETNKLVNLGLLTLELSRQDLPDGKRTIHAFKVPNFRPANKIMVAGSNQNGNDKVKENAIALFKAADFSVFSSCELYRSQSNSSEGNKLVFDKLKVSDILYAVCSVDGYTGFATAAKLGFAKAKEIKIYSSHAIADSDLRYLVDEILTPKELINADRNSKSS